MINNLMYPVAYGVSLINNNKKASCIITPIGRINVFNKVNKKSNKKQDIFLIRGFIFFFMGLYRTICGLFEYNDYYTNKVKPFKKIQNSLNISLNNILYFIIIISSVFVAYLVLGVIPIKLSYYLTPKNYDMFFKRLIIAIIKCFIIYISLILIKQIPTFREYYKFNSAVKEFQDKNNKVNFLTYFICSMFLSVIILSLFGLTVNYWFSPFVNLFIFVLCFAINFEIFREVQQIKGLQWLINVFYFLIKQNPSQKGIKCVNIVLKEIEQGNSSMIQNTQDKIIFSEAYVTAKEILEKNGKFEKSDLDFIFCEVLNKSRAEVKLLKEISKTDYKKIINIVEKRANGEPITKIFGRAYFYGFTFKVTKDVLSPRMDTEILVEQVIKNCNKNLKVIDIGTGSGAIAITIAKETGAKVTAVDVSEEALKIAKQNAKLNCVNINFKKSNLFNGISKLSKFDIIVSNPPYIPTKDISNLEEEVKRYDPVLALDGGIAGLDFYEKIINEAPNKLKSGGMIFFEVGINQAKDVKKLLQKNFKDIRIVKDYNKIERVVFATVNF